MFRPAFRVVPSALAVLTLATVATAQVTYQPVPQPVPQPAPQPVYQPAYGQPTYGQPTYGQPTYQPAYQPPVYAQPPYTAAIQLAPQQLDSLLGRIALYPDPLLAQVMIASTTAPQVSDAARWSAVYPTATEDQIAAQPWSQAVKTLIHYPQALQMMAADPAWTAQLGTAYQQQPIDVMNSVQRLRVAAQSAGTLYTTPQQTVLVSGNVIQIVPAEPTVIYVPTYDPAVVFVPRPIHAPPPRDVIHFSLGVHTSRGFDFDLNWGDHAIRPITTPPSYRPGPPSWGRPAMPSPRDHRFDDDHRDRNRHDDHRDDDHHDDRDHH